MTSVAPIPELSAEFRLTSLQRGPLLYADYFFKIWYSPRSVEFRLKLD
jgi:hypothetical protein